MQNCCILFDDCQSCSTYNDISANIKYQDADIFQNILCGVIKLIINLKDQVDQDYLNNINSPTPATILAATQLAVAINNIDGIALLDNMIPPHTTDALNAFSFGLNIEINCQLVKVLLKTCIINDSDISKPGLLWLTDPNSLYSDTMNTTALQFVCCLLEQFNKIKLFTSNYYKHRDKHECYIKNKCE